MEIMTAGLGSKLTKINHAAAGLTAVVVGVTNTFVVASKNPNLPFGSQVMIFTSKMIGPGLAGKFASALGIPVSSLPPQGVTMWGWLNPSTYGGAVMLIIGHVGKSIVGGKYGLRYAWPWLFAVGGALLGSGIIGGLFDPNPGSTTTVAAIGSSAGRVAFPLARTGGFAGVAGFASPGTQGGQFGFNSGRGSY